MLYGAMFLIIATLHRQVWTPLDTLPPIVPQGQWVVEVMVTTQDGEVKTVLTDGIRWFGTSKDDVVAWMYKPSPYHAENQP